mgnify:FL=1|jgi:hypothetical protein
MNGRHMIWRLFCSVGNCFVISFLHYEKDLDTEGQDRSLDMEA